MSRGIINNKFVVDNMIFITDEQHNKYICSKKIGIKNITIDLLYDFLSNDYFYDYILDLFNENIDSLLIVYVNYDGVTKIDKYYKMDILNALSIAISDDRLVLDEQILSRFKKLISNISYEVFKTKYIDDYFTYIIDDNNVNIPVSLFIDFLECSNEEYNKFFNLENSDKIIGIPKEYFIYSLIKFFRSNNIFEKYYIPKEIKERYNELLESRKIDLQALNKINKTFNVNSEKIKLNSELETSIFKGISTDLNKLEKAIYIYLKLCDLLTYDEEFYTLNSEDNINNKHENIKKLESITLSNNSVICYEFNAIYSKFLDKIEVNYETNASYSDIFGGGHEDLTFKCGKYLVKADSTITIILYSDIVNVKLGKSLNGLICQNINKNTQKEFKKNLEKVYKIYIDEKIKNKKNLINFDELMKKYKLIREKENIELFDKFKILIQEINKSDLIGVDAMSYVHQLTKLIFNNNELSTNFNFTIIKNISKSSNTINLCGIFTLNNNIYYSYIPKKVLSRLSKEEIENLFNEGFFEYIDLEHQIPGININKKVMRITKTNR
ncbi:MAG: hypothetical protein J6K21_01805 [Bacilli bacterium]|nr:hypothetical protein [Bacilli bacterium]